jgi:prolipoprotein diacylglyceryl transferase
MFLPFSIPSPDPAWQAFELGPLTIRLYALCILAGIVAAVILTSRRLTARGAHPGATLDIVIWAIPIGIIVARIYHVLTHVSDYFYEGADLAKTLYIWEGGIAIYGGLIGGAIGAYIGSRRTGIRFWSFADALAPGMLLAQAMGRFGNWFNHELFGLPTTLPWGLEIEVGNAKFPDGLPADTLFHPTFLYEMIWNLIGIALILYLERRLHLRWGRAFGLYLIWYGLGRSWLEAIRIDPTSDAFLGIPANIWTSFAAIALGVAIFVVQGRRHPEPETSVYLPGRERDADPGQHLDAASPAADGPGRKATEPREAHAIPAPDVDGSPDKNRSASST